jgi:hypothetical protein
MKEKEAKANNHSALAFVVQPRRLAAIMSVTRGEAHERSGNDDKFPKLPDGERDLIRSYSHVQIWKNMETLVETGKVKAIGVCNVSLSPTGSDLA